MTRQTPRTRRYHSTLREAQASRTRSAILAAARDLFEAGGFSGTTIAAIATRAGVSAQTVYAVFGSKAKVVRAIVEQMEQSADSAQWRERIAAEQDPPKVLHAFAEWSRTLFASMPRVVTVGAAATELEELAVEGNARRREALTALIAGLARDGVIRADLTEAQAVDRAWLLTGLDTYLNATTGCDWSPADYASWLSETLAQQLLEPTP